MIHNNENLNVNNLSLKPIKRKYIDEINEILEDNEAKEMLGIVENTTIRTYTGKNIRCYAIIEDNNEFIGIVELFNISWKSKRAELSIVIKPGSRSKGYGYQAIKKVLDLGFKEFGLNRIWLRVLEYNEKAINLYEKIGFVREGLCREESLRNGRFVSQIQMSILKREWEQKGI